MSSSTSPAMPPSMSPKAGMMVASLSIWMYAAITCTALPFFFSMPDLKSAGSMAPLFAALAVGALLGIPLSLLATRLSGFAAPKKNVWAMLTAREAIVFGIICWGIPMGLMFALNEFLQYANPFAVVSALIVWPASGLAFGLLARWLGQRRGTGSKMA